MCLENAKLVRLEKLWTWAVRFTANFQPRKSGALEGPVRLPHSPHGSSQTVSPVPVPCSTAQGSSCDDVRTYDCHIVWNCGHQEHRELWHRHHAEFCTAESIQFGGDVFFLEECYEVMKSRQWKNKSETGLCSCSLEAIQTMGCLTTFCCSPLPDLIVFSTVRNLITLQGDVFNWACEMPLFVKCPSHREFLSM